MTKINMIELEMTQEEKKKADEILRLGCSSVKCHGCPFNVAQIGHVRCIPHSDSTTLDIKIVEPELKLYEGMPVDNLTFRRQTCLRILSVHQTLHTDYPITVVCRNVDTLQICTMSFTENGKHAKNQESWLDIIRVKNN
jgi:hypothetical protein